MGDITDNKNHETQKPICASPMPDLLNAESEAMPETTDNVFSEDMSVDASDCVSAEEETDVTCDDAEESVSSDVEPESQSPEESTAILNEIAALSGQVQSLEKLFNTKILHSEHEKKVVDQMHRELQKYKDDMYAQLVRPILLDVIVMRDSILKQLKEHRSKLESEQHIPLQMFETYAFDTDEILEKNSIVIYKSEVNTDFVPIRQRAVKKTLTNDQSLHSKVAESIADGYSYQDKTISPEKVVVYVYEATQEQSTENNHGEASQNG